MSPFPYIHLNQKNPEKSNPLYCLRCCFYNDRKVFDNIWLYTTILPPIESNPRTKFFSDHNFIFLLLFWFITVAPITQTQPIPGIEYGKC